MSSLDTALGAVSGFKGALKDAKTQRQSDEDRKFELQQRTDSVRRANKAEDRSDLDWGLNHAATQDQFEQHRQLFNQQAQAEGLHTMVDAVNANVDPSMIEQQMNSVGKWKIKPGTLQYDPNTTGPDRQISFMGEGGTPFTGTVGQLQALFGQQAGKKDLINVPQGGSIYDPNTGKSVFTNPKEDSKQGKNYLTAGANQRVFQLDENGQIARDAKGNPKMVIDAMADGPDGANGGRKISPFNPEVHQQNAVKIMNDAFKTKWNNETKSYVLDNPDDSERQVYGSDLITSFLTNKGPEAMNYGTGEIANAAFKASKARLTLGEAQAKVKGSGIKQDSPEFTARVAQTLRQSDVKAAQVWQDELKQLDAKQSRSASQTGKGDGKKRSLDDIFGSADDGQ